MILFPLSLIAGVVIARRYTLPRALLVASTLFGLAVLVAWKVQGFPPSERDLLWILLVWVLAGLGYWSQRRSASAPA